MTLDERTRKALGITRPGPSASASLQMVEAWREEVWDLLRRCEPLLYREVAGGRVGLRAAADELERLGYTIGGDPR